MYVYFTDRDLGKRFAHELAAAGISVERLDQHFKHDTPDDQWIAEVARRGWIAITHNKRIRYTPNQIKAVFDSGLALLVLVGHVSTIELARNFVRTHSRIERFIGRTRPPFIAKVFRPGESELARNPLAAGRIEMWRS